MHTNKYKDLNEKVFDKEFLFDESSSKKVDDFLLKKDFLETKKSQIHGKGVFTKIIIPANEVFYLVPLGDVRSTPTPRAARIATGRFVFDEKVLNYINHSCNLNSEIVLEQQRVVLRAKREILAGEEITLDYCLLEEKNNLIPCNCKTEKCRNFFFIS